MTSPAMLPSLAAPPLFMALAPARSILIAGAGGGFDVYAGLPLALALWQNGAQVHLANLSFSELELTDRDIWAAENVAAVTPDSASPDWYFPERTLARWLAAQQLPSTVYAFPRSASNRCGTPIGTSSKHWISTRWCSSTAAPTSCCAVTKPPSARPWRTSPASPPWQAWTWR
ncbi:hypothetical protein ACFQ1L_15450 [Phytohabitans flavus]|uniref:hypothetical protein n=1 Tax=Phytohabitans flavus TaxID=1076124 RepID=UPI003638A485